MAAGVYLTGVRPASSSSTRNAACQLTGTVTADFNEGGAAFLIGSEALPPARPALLIMEKSVRLLQSRAGRSRPAVSGLGISGKHPPGVSFQHFPSRSEDVSERWESERALFKAPSS